MGAAASSGGAALCDQGQDLREWCQERLRFDIRLDIKEKFFPRACWTVIPQEYSHPRGCLSSRSI